MTTKIGGLPTDRSVYIVRLMSLAVIPVTVMAKVNETIPDLYRLVDETGRPWHAFRDQIFLRRYEAEAELIARIEARKAELQRDHDHQIELLDAKLAKLRLPLVTEG